MLRFNLACSIALALPWTAFAQKAVPAASGSNFTVTAGGATLQVGPANSARINSLKYQGAEMLYLVSSGGNILWGSTFWVSPQAYWTASCKSANNASCWPPPAAVDGSDFTGGINPADTAISYTGPVDGYTKLRIRKTFTANTKDSSFTNRYHLVNTSASPITWAPWEDTRFPSGGITFWPTGSGAPTGHAGMLKQTKDTLGVTWFAWDSSASLTGSTKIFADAGAAGWFAHVDKSRVLFIKKFADTPPAKKAPGVENECEIYATPALQEMELQGPYADIPGTDSLAWEVKWYVRKLPDNVALGRNKALADFTAQVIAGSATGLEPRRAGPREGLEMRYSRRSLEMTLPRPMDLSVSLADARGKTMRVLSERRFEAGEHSLSLPRETPRGPLWLLVRERKTGLPALRAPLTQP